jgi:hypothetical protein
MEGEDANSLKFGPEFEGVQILTNAEVAIVLSRLHGKHIDDDMQITPSLAKTLAYVKRYNNMGEGQGMAESKELRQALESYEHITEDGTTVKLRPFEVAALANLMVADSTAEEAFALLPSLKQEFAEEEIEAVLEIIRKQQTRSTL